MSVLGEHFTGAEEFKVDVVFAYATFFEHLIDVGHEWFWATEVIFGFVVGLVGDDFIEQLLIDKTCAVTVFERFVIREGITVAHVCFDVGFVFDDGVDFIAQGVGLAVERCEDEVDRSGGLVVGEGF